MTRDEILDKAAQAMLAKHDPVHAADSADPRKQRWTEISLRMYRDRFETGLDAVENDLRREEGDGARQGVLTLRQVAHELDSRPIVESGADETAWWDEEARRTVGGYE